MDSRRCRFHRLVCTWAILRTSVFEAAVAQQDVEPRVELSPFIEPLQVPECVEKRALDSVGSVRVVTRERARMGKRAPLIPINQMAECLNLTL